MNAMMRKAAKRDPSVARELSKRFGLNMGSSGDTSIHTVGRRGCLAGWSRASQMFVIEKAGLFGGSTCRSNACGKIMPSPAWAPWPSGRLESALPPCRGDSRALRRAVCETGCAAARSVSAKLERRRGVNRG